MNNIDNIINIGIPMIVIPIADKILCKIFSSTARWFQLHSLINLIITTIMLPDIIDFYKNPIKGIKYNENIIRNICETNNFDITTSYISQIFNTCDMSFDKLDSYFIILLHLYHILTFKSLTKMDYFHHILFVMLGVFPSAIYIKSNIVRLGFISGCGITGFIEYGSLALVKNGKITSIVQKRINSFMYAYIRCPLAIFGCAFNYVFYMEGLLPYDNPYMVIYINLLMFLNATYYNKLTIENYMETQYRLIDKKEVV